MSKTSPEVFQKLRDAAKEVREQKEAELYAAFVTVFIGGFFIGVVVALIIKLLTGS